MEENISVCSLTENKARNKTMKLQSISEKFKKGEDVTLRVVRNDKGKRVRRTVKGTVIGKNDRFITVQQEHYVEAFNFTDFYTGRAVLI